jgi:uncharacterized protein (TIGR02145 family)
MNNIVAFKMYWGLIIYILLSLASCEKELPINRDFDPLISQAVKIKINTTEIGGSDLKLISSRDDESPLHDGSFNTIVSKQNVQLLFVEDTNSELRALAISIPNGYNTDELQISNYSTALSLIFISPGIITSNVEDAQKTVDNIITLSSFVTFQAFLKNNLKSTSLNKIVIEDTYNSLLRSCISEYYDAYSSKSTETTKSDLNWINDIALDEVNPPIKYELHNRALRCVNLIQRDLNQDGGEVDCKALIVGLNGGPKFSYGSLITLGFFWKHTTEQFDYEPKETTTQSEFWIAGLGWKEATLNPPESVIGMGNANVETVLNYIIFPVIELIWGIEGLCDIPTDDMKVFVASLKLLLKDAPNTLDTSNENAASALIDFTLSVVKVIMMVKKNVIPENIESLVANAGVQTLPEIAGDFFKWGSVILSSGNVGGLIANLLVVEKYTKFNILAYNQPPRFPALWSPANNSIDLSKPVALNWSASALAETYTIQVSRISDFSAIDFQYVAVTGNRFQLNELDQGTKYYWRMNATNNYGTSLWSEVWNFTTESDNGIIFNPNLTYGSVSDIDGNTYKTIQIGTQTWMAENLKTTRFNDGSPMNNIGTWGGYNYPCYRWYNDEPITYKATFGALYNWAAVNKGKLCPMGWHVPSHAERTTLIDYLGGHLVAGDKLKETGTTHWPYSNSDVTNESGFTALPGGYCGTDGIYKDIGGYGYWWTSSDYTDLLDHNAWYYLMFSDSKIVFLGTKDKRNGYSVRCIKD